MLSFVLTDEQKVAIDKAKQWYLSNATKPFVLMGCAGSGKSSIVKFLIESLGIDKEKDVKYVTFTGKAASVLINKGNPATTVHKLIYDPIINGKGNIVGFELKKSINGCVKLIIVDEFFMLNSKIMNDLLSFNIKTICLGDNHQLPPPFGSVNELYKNPDVILTKPLRQSLDNPIIYLAQEVINHHYLQYGKYGDNVEIIRKSQLNLEKMKNADQIIAGKNDTVKKLNNFYRKNFLNIDIINDVYPKKNEKLICLQNNWNLTCEENKITTNLVNGMSLILENDLVISPHTKHSFANIRPDFYNNHFFKNIPIDMLYFQYGFTKDDELFDVNNIKKYNYGEILKKRNIMFDNYYKLNKLTYGYAITTHKSQGSEFKDVFFIFEPFKSSKDELYWQMLYTGLTRASERITIAI